VFDPDLIEDECLRDIVRNGRLTEWGWETDSSQIAALKAEGAAIALNQLFNEDIAVVFKQHEDPVIVWGDMDIITVLGSPDPDDESGSITFYFAEETNFSHLVCDRKTKPSEKAANAGKTLSPAEVEILMHCYYSLDPHPRICAPFFREVVREFLDLGVIRDEGGDVYRTTDMGNEWVWEVCRAPLPHNRAKRKGG